MHVIYNTTKCGCYLHQAKLCQHKSLRNTFYRKYEECEQSAILTWFQKWRPYPKSLKMLWLVARLAELMLSHSDIPVRLKLTQTMTSHNLANAHQQILLFSKTFSGVSAFRTLWNLRDINYLLWVFFCLLQSKTKIQKQNTIKWKKLEKNKWKLHSVLLQNLPKWGEM